MRFKRYKRSLGVINLTPLIDVVFLLVVFFMVTTKFMSYKAMELELGGASTDSVNIEPMDEKQEILVKVHRNKQVEVNGFSMPADTLSAYLKPRLLRNSNQNITIVSSKNILVQDIVSAMDQVRLAGGKNFTITAGDN